MLPVTPNPCCSFCGKNQKQVKKLIAAPGVYICNGCVDLSCKILEEGGDFGWKRKSYEELTARPLWPTPTPPSKVQFFARISTQLAEQYALPEA